MVALLALPAASFAQLKVMMSGGFAAAYQEILPEFESTTGVTVTTIRGHRKGTGLTPSAPNFVAECLLTW